MHECHSTAQHVARIGLVIQRTGADADLAAPHVQCLHLHAAALSFLRGCKSVLQQVLPSCMGVIAQHSMLRALASSSSALVRMLILLPPTYSVSTCTQLHSDS